MIVNFLIYDKPSHQSRLKENWNTSLYILLQAIWNCDPRLISQFIRYVTVTSNPVFTESLPYGSDDPMTKINDGLYARLLLHISDSLSTQFNFFTNLLINLI